MSIKNYVRMLRDSEHKKEEVQRYFPYNVYDDRVYVLQAKTLLVFRNTAIAAILAVVVTFLTS